MENKKEKTYENYPAWIVLISNLFSIAIFIIGAFIVYQLGLIWMILYILYIIILEFKLIKYHCVDCYYYNKTCAFGKGRLCSLFFRKGSSKNFCKKQMSWKDIIPDFLVSLVPIIIGIILLIIDFNWLILIFIIILFILASMGNSFVRGKLACKYCKQRKIGCPAQKLFEKNER